MSNGQGSFRAGMLYGVGAYFIWGLIPLYFKAVPQVSPMELLAQRIVWSFFLLAIVLTALQRWGALAEPLRSFRTRGLLTISALLLAGNWLVYIYSVQCNQVVQASLGYFMLPLFSVFLGLIFFGERLRPGQWLAVGLAGCGIAFLVLTVDDFPWLAIGVATSFGLYGMVRKITPVDGLSGVTIETLLLTPISAIALLCWGNQGTLKFGSEGRLLDALIIASGIVTAVPLICFGQATRRLPLSTLGFLQYLGPSVALLIAVFAFGETLGWQKIVCFAFVWTGLVLLATESVLHTRKRIEIPLQPAPVSADMEHALGAGK